MAPTKLWLDRETFSELDLKVVGTYVYAESAEDLLVAYALDDEPEQVWDVTEDPQCPADLLDGLLHAKEVWAHNAQFDKAIHNGAKQRHLPRVELERWRCSMALALSHALPGGLGDLCKVLGVPDDQAKDKEGKKLIALFTRPQPSNRKVRRATRHTHPEEWAKFKRYAGTDIVAMRECVKRMPTWNWDASAVAEWHCDQRINERGFQVDRELTAAGARAAIVEKERIGVRFRELTGGVVDRPSQREQLKTFIENRFGLKLDDTKRDSFEQYLKDPTLDPVLAELMRLSIAANKTSTAKYAALHPAVSADGRFRGGLQFAGASRTRRWAGRLFQPQNLPSRGLPPVETVEEYIAHLKEGVHDLFHDNLMLLGAAALRGCVVVPPGKKMIVADLSNIEGRVLAWLAGEAWKLKAFREYDAGTGPDLYNITAVSIIGGDPWKVPKSDRNVFGKVPDLASGYQGGVAGYQTFAHAYGVRMADHWGTIQKMIAPEHVEKARQNLEKWGRPQLESLEINEIEWLASETCKLAWRARHPATVRLWYGLQDACKNAINEWGTIFPVGNFLKVRCVTHRGHRWMVIRLPSGRLLTYYDPRLIDNSITYMGESAEEGKTTRQWIRVFTHGGKLTGNCCQTTARDILTPALLTAEKRGYLPILSVHDEALTETPDNDDFSAQGLVDILSTNPAWAPGLPLSAAGFETYRYKKD
jgi:DNA polymerase